jgi:hypothetical protein
VIVGTVLPLQQQAVQRGVYSARFETLIWSFWIM